MDKWEFLKQRALLAGIKVDDNGTNVEFTTEEDGIDLIGLFWKKLDPGVEKDPHEPAAQWLMQRGVNLPGWGLPWPLPYPEPPATFEEACQNAEAFNAASMKSLDRFLEEEETNPWNLTNPNGYWHD